MREGKYWFNLMTEDEQINWYRDWGGWSVTCDFTKIYDNFEEFIKNTVMQPPYSYGYNFVNNQHWWGVINKYSGHDILLPIHRIKKHLL